MEAMLVAAVTAAVSFTMIYFSSDRKPLGPDQRTYDPLTQGVFTLSYFLLACWTYSLTVSAAVFILSLLIRATRGRLFGIFLAAITSSSSIWADPGKYALIGAAAQLGFVCPSYARRPQPPRIPLTAREIMSSLVTCFSQMEKVGTIVDILSNKSTNHNGLPVVPSVSDNNKVGLVTRKDLACYHLGKYGLEELQLEQT